MKDWRNILNTEYDKDLDKVAQVFTPSQKLSSIGNALEAVFQFQGDFILVGGIARRFHSTPRNTGDIDILFKDESDLRKFLINNIGNYKKLRGHAIIVQGVEIDLLTSEFLQLPQEIIDYVFATKESIENNISIASKEGIILLKLYRLSSTDDNDIRALIEAGGKNLKVDDILKLSGNKREVIQSILEQSKMFLEENYKYDEKGK
jgi:hypothetical protein